MAIHAHAKGLNATRSQVGIERRGDRAHVALEIQQLLIHLGVIGNYGATEDIGMPTQVLRGGVQNVVRAECEGVLQVRRGEGIIHQHLRIALDLSHRRNIGDIQRRVGRGFQPDELGIVLHRGGDGIHIAGINDGHLHAPLREIIKQAVGTAVGVIAQNDVVAGAHQDAHHRIGGCHAGGKDAGVIRALQCSQGLLEGAHRRVGHTPVFKAAAQLREAILGERGRSVDRHVDGSHVRIRVISSVNGTG